MLLPTVVLIGFTCPAITVATVILRALDRVRERVLGLLCRSITQIPARQVTRGVPDLPPAYGCSVVPNLLPRGQYDQRYASGTVLISEVLLQPAGAVGHVNVRKKNSSFFNERMQRGRGLRGSTRSSSLDLGVHRRTLVPASGMR